MGEFSILKALTNIFPYNIFVFSPILVKIELNWTKYIVRSLKWNHLLMVTQVEEMGWLPK